MVKVMYGKVLVANDGSAGGYSALRAGIDIAEKYNAELHMITIEEAQVWGMSGDIAPVILIEETRKYLEEVQERSKLIAQMKGINLTAYLPVGEPVNQITDFAKNFDLLVIGFTPHSSFYKCFVGSVSSDLVEDVPCSVLVVKIDAEGC